MERFFLLQLFAPIIARLPAAQPRADTVCPYKRNHSPHQNTPRKTRLDVLQKEAVHEDDVALDHGAALLELRLQLHLPDHAARGSELPHHLPVTVQLGFESNV